jgi:hypothetical protein
MDRFAFNAQMGVAPGGWAAGNSRCVRIADINAAGEADPAIADHDFAVSAKIDVVGPQSAQAERIEPGGHRRPHHAQVAETRLLIRSEPIASSNSRTWTPARAFSTNTITQPEFQRHLAARE